MKYLSDDNSKSKDQNRLLTKLGSFWLDFLDDPDQARGLLAAAGHTNLVGKLENGLKQLLSRKSTHSEYLSVRIDELKIVKAQHI